jgi:hypothetical protein
MSGAFPRNRRAHAMAIASLVVASGCGSGGVTAGRIEKAVGATFANLIQVEEAMLELPPVDAAALRVAASCTKIDPANRAGGPGEYKCTLSWYAPGQRRSLRDAYDVSVTTDGCYTAKVDGEEAHLGGPTITRRDGRTIANVVYAFDGCFDPT